MAVNRQSLGGRALALVKRGAAAAHIAMYRRSGGRLGGRFAKCPILLLTTRGRKTGRLRTTPLVYFEREGTYVISSSNAGHWEPAWFRNLQSDPAVSIEVGRLRIPVRARVAPPEESAALWAIMESKNAAFAKYPVSRGIAIPMVVLTPR